MGDHYLLSRDAWRKAQDSPRAGPAMSNQSDLDEEVGVAETKTIEARAMPEM